MRTIIMQAATYERLIRQHTTRTDRMMYRDAAVQLPDGSYEYELTDVAAAALDEIRLEGETYEEAIERALSITAGQVS